MSDRHMLGDHRAPIGERIRNTHDGKDFRFKVVQVQDDLRACDPGVAARAVGAGEPFDPKTAVVQFPKNGVAAPVERAVEQDVDVLGGGGDACRARERIRSERRWAAAVPRQRGTRRWLDCSPNAGSAGKGRRTQASSSTASRHPTAQGCRRWGSSAASRRTGQGGLSPARWCGAHRGRDDWSAPSHGQAPQDHGAMPGDLVKSSAADVMMVRRRHDRDGETHGMQITREELGLKPFSGERVRSTSALCLRDARSLPGLAGRASPRVNRSVAVDKNTAGLA